VFDIRCPLREAAYVSKDQKGLICSEGMLTFYEYDQLVTAAARKLQNAGVQQGERVGLALNPGWRQPVLLLAVIRAGAVACVIDPALGSDHMAECADKVLCRRLIVSDASVISSTATTPLNVSVAEDFANLGAIGDFSGLEESIPGNRPATILFTGKRGGQRAILHSYANHYYSALGSNANTKLRSKNRHLFSPSMHEIEGVAGIFRCIMSGATLCIPDRSASLSQSIIEGEVTHAFLSRADVESLLADSALRESALKMVMVNDTLDHRILKRAIELGIQLLSVFSLPEMASQIAAVAPGTSPDKQVTRGLPLKYQKVRIGTGGNIQLRGHTLMAGYMDGNSIDAALDGEGWYDTGSKGLLDDQGYLTVVVNS